MRLGQRVCPDCLRDLTRALHEPGCPTDARERGLTLAQLKFLQRHPERGYTAQELAEAMEAER